MDSRPLRMLSGSEIVARGKNVADCILPEVGLKEVTPNGSWLEKKQVQTALELRKALVAAERINKLETLSHAEWIDTLRLAKVTQLSGGHWQFLGHNVNGIIYLLPEEILYLMEVNCLQLKHNEVPVSLQKAYNLLLDDQMSLVQYKVYASLSRVGYKLFRHDRPMPLTQVPKEPPINKTISEKDITVIDLNYDGNSNLLSKGVQPIEPTDICIILDDPVSVQDATSTECSIANDDSIMETEESLEMSQTPDIESTEKSILSIVTETPYNGDSNKKAEKSSGLSQPPKNIESTTESTFSVVPVASNDGDSNRDAEKSLDLLQPLNNVESSEKSTLSTVPAIPNNGDSNKEPEKSLDLSQPPKNTEFPKESSFTVDPAATNDGNSNRDAEKSSDLLQKPNNVESTLTVVPETSNNKGTVKSLCVSQPPNNTKSTLSVDLVALNDVDSNMESDKALDTFQPTNTETTEEAVKSLGLSQAPTKLESTLSVSTNDVANNVAKEINSHNQIDSTKESTISVDPLASNDFNLSKASQILIDDPKHPTSNDEKSTEFVMRDLPSNDTNRDSKESSHPIQRLNDNNLNEEYSVSLEPQLTNTIDVVMDCPILIDQPPKSNPDDCTHSEFVHLDYSGGAIFSIDGQGVVRVIDKVVSSDVEMERVSSVTLGQTEKTDADIRISQPSKPELPQNSYKVKQWKIENRKIRSTDSNNLQEMFKTFPDFYKKQIVTVNVPNDQYIPRNIYLNNTSYVIDMNKLKWERQRKPTTNKPNYRAITNSSESKRKTPKPQRLPIPSPQLFVGIPTLRSRYPMFNRIFPMQPFNQAFLYRPTFPSHTLPYRINEQTGRTNRPRAHFQLPKRQRDSKSNHLDAIKHCAQRLKQFGSPPENCRSSLAGLVSRYNEIYNERVEITPDYTIIENLEVIELDDDEVPTKKPKLSREKYDLYLTEVKTLANRLNVLQRKKQPVSKHKRAFSNLLRHFNDTFDCDFYLNPKGELIDRKLVVLDSSSDSDVVATEDLEPRTRKKRRADSKDNGSSKKRKVVRNPFSIAINKASVNQPINLPPVTNATDLLKYFHKYWLPNDDDFGKAVLSSKTDVFHSYNDSQKLYEFMDDLDSFSNWVELKLSFYSKMASILSFEQDLSTHSMHLTMNNSTLKPILNYSFDDWTTALEQLRIIKTNTDVKETSLKIDFNVYNRDVQNFRKTDPPKPHFRIVCVDECSPFPSGAEVRALHSRHDDVTIVFAIVGVSSITYLQIKPTELPVYVGNDRTVIF